MTGAVPLSGSDGYRIPGLDGVWRMSGLETTDMGADGRATVHFVRDEPPDPQRGGAVLTPILRGIDADARAEFTRLEAQHGCEGGAAREYQRGRMSAIAEIMERIRH